MYKEQISEEELKRVKSLPRLDYDVYCNLIELGIVKRITKLKSPKTIFYSEDEKSLLYLSPYHKQLFVCGVFNDVKEGGQYGI